MPLRMATIRPKILEPNSPNTGRVIMVVETPNLPPSAARGAEMTVRMAMPTKVASRADLKSSPMARAPPVSMVDRQMIHPATVAKMLAELLRSSWGMAVVT